MRVLLGTLLLALSLGASADQWVSGYTRKDGTYVQPHMRSDPDGYRPNNYSTRGTVNPYTGERGYRSDDGYRSNGGSRSLNPYGRRGW
ncbi:MAG: hypothetical protein ACREXW_01165 [Gammaproteobacteria bacterium]